MKFRKCSGLFLFAGIILLALLLLPGCGREVQKTKLRMVTNATFPPYETIRNGRIVGIDPDIMQEFCKRNGFELDIENMEFGALIAAVQSGKADIAASGITVTEDRKKKIDFSIPYTSAHQLVTVRKNSGISANHELKGRKIGVQEGTTGDVYVKENLSEPQRYKDAATAIQALLTGKVDAVVLDSDPSHVFVRKNPTLQLLPEPLVTENYAFAVSKERPDLLMTLNSSLQEMIADGTLQQIIERNKKENDTSDTGKAGQTGVWERLKEDLRVNFVAESRYLYLLRGFVITLLIALLSVLIGIMIGFVVAVIRSTADQTGKFQLLNLICKVYLTVIRGTPVVVQLLIIYFVIFGAVDINKIVVAVATFGLNSGAYVAEIIRSGIMSIDRGQLEAGRSLGLSYSRTMCWIILPQALKNVLPALGNEFIVLLKETSISGYIALEDLTKGGDIIRSQTYNAFMPLIAVALIYLAVVMLFSKLLAVLEGRLKKNE